MINDKLKEIRESTGMNKRQFASYLGVKYTTYNNYETGVREPASDFLIHFSRKLDTSIDYLMGLSNVKDVLHSYELRANEVDIINKYRSINEKGRAAVDLILNHEYEYAAGETLVDVYTPDQLLKMRDYLYMREEVCEDILRVSRLDVPVGTDFGVRILDDSMERLYEKGTILFIQETSLVDFDDEGLFVVNEKMYYGSPLVNKSEKKMIIVSSFNTENESVNLSDVITIGKVLGSYSR